MRLVAADCSAIYTGRGDTKLGSGLRAIMIKGDGSVSIHNDLSNKPLNYMKCATFSESRLEDGTLVWTFDHRRESSRIEIYRIITDVEVPLIGEEDEGLVRDGTEPQLQAWVAENITVLGDGYEFIGREFPTGDGPVDLFVHDGKHNYEAVEIKRVATIGAVDQVRRYVEAFNNPGVPKDQDYGMVTGTIAALDIRPKAVLLAQRKGIRLVNLPLDWKDQRDQYGTLSEED